MRLQTVLPLYLLSYRPSILGKTWACVLYLCQHSDPHLMKRKHRIQKKKAIYNNYYKNKHYFPISSKIYWLLLLFSRGSRQPLPENFKYFFFYLSYGECAVYIHVHFSIKCKRKQLLSFWFNYFFYLCFCLFWFFFEFCVFCLTLVFLFLSRFSHFVFQYCRVKNGLNSAENISNFGKLSKFIGETEIPDFVLRLQLIRSH